VADITTYDDALAAIWARSGYDRGFINDPLAGDEEARRGLRRMHALLRRLGNPERSYRVIHVAGSKGKGSTCIFIDAILRAGGVRCGRYLSPHLHSYRERFVADDEPISQPAFAALTATVLAAAEDVERTMPEPGQVTAFELSTAMALQWFAQTSCEAAVIEVGLGGTLDATNVVDPAVSVITALDYEHTAILGGTMAEIASNKAGIIKPGRPVVSASQPREGMAVIEARADVCGAPLLVSGRDWEVSGSSDDFAVTGPWGTMRHLAIPLAGRHQMENAALAIAAVSMLRDMAPFGMVDEDAVRRGLAAARHPGRFEEVALSSGQVVVVDGAHSPASATSLAETVRERFPDATVTMVVGMFSDKDPHAVLAPLRDCADGWIAVAPANPRAIPVKTLREVIEAMGARCDTASSVADGIGLAREAGRDLVVVTGSLATAAEARAALGLPAVTDHPG
jgi:dihydrofolate synthase / folylpolyglutamate synthase